MSDVLISGSTIEMVDTVETPDDARVIECRGLAVAPGFIDSHSHSDLQVLNRTEKVAQGVTAEVVSNCGFSPFPAPPDRSLLRDLPTASFVVAPTGVGRAPERISHKRTRSTATTVFPLVGK